MFSEPTVSEQQQEVLVAAGYAPRPSGRGFVKLLREEPAKGIAYELRLEPQMSLWLMTLQYRRRLRYGANERMEVTSRAETVAMELLGEYESIDAVGWGYAENVDSVTVDARTYVGEEETFESASRRLMVFAAYLFEQLGSAGYPVH